MKEREAQSSKLFALKQILEGTAEYTGEEFFMYLVKILSEVLHVKGVWITQFLKEKNMLDSLAFYLDGKFVKEYCYPVENTPCEPVLETNDICHFSNNLINLFPRDPDLAELNAVSYLGIALRDMDGQVLGHLAALDSKPMKEVPEFFAVFKIFAGRAAAELRRIKKEQELKESNHKLDRILNGTSEAILELDSDLNITQANTAAEKEFGYSRVNFYNLSVQKIVDSEAFKKILSAISKLKLEEKAFCTTRIQGKIRCISASKKTFSSKVSMSCYRFQQKHFYSLFIRNVEEKEKAEEKIRELHIETHLLRNKLKENFNSNIIGKSPQILSVLDLISKVAKTDSTVLITGETGTGKELVAEAIFKNSKRNHNSFVSLNCAALPAEIIESELFGHVKGAFTGANSSREGRFSLADKGTIFLDEIGELPLQLQSKLLRVLQEGEFEPVGSSRTKKVDVRIIAATHRDLFEEMTKGNFREDLYYRLNVFPIPVAPLRDRGEDIILLANAFIERLAKQSATNLEPLSETSKQQLLSHHWPGNVRELQNIIERAVIISEDGRLDFSQILSGNEIEKKTVFKREHNRVLTDKEMAALEKRNLLLALHLTGWRISGKKGAAKLLQIPPSTLSSRLAKFGIKKAGNTSGLEFTDF
ncbi:sigma 54-interacting transcriptional regulator [Salinimicrobium sp. TH3]|uniref:sigma 54-interacting transcriptional regulator n=1 Tax=Salinimicrobium sp. TH3 TaxID=2997342 RepID=UPI002274F7D1|nr:sigma 54-interacting transcriptional regulator [Salinimicrobium sp. TH3]MCY2687463.1 sigma 54-interacting transcriptional regulator [Salinimicrobium sp. TH3]